MQEKGRKSKRGTLPSLLHGLRLKRASKGCGVFIISHNCKNTLPKQVGCGLQSVPVHRKVYRYKSCETANPSLGLAENPKCTGTTIKAYRYKSCTGTTIKAVPVGALATTLQKLWKDSEYRSNTQTLQFAKVQCVTFTPPKKEFRPRNSKVTHLKTPSGGDRDSAPAKRSQAPTWPTAPLGCSKEPSHTEYPDSAASAPREPRSSRVAPQNSNPPAAPKV
uniref:Uncharacterized protein n=1 Tax=Ananas comosus var. bracteatus TaxID=296719 RepID=A0A6V7NQG1_ANACO|nr:unnamed protein product [Ananas comosus var. bracteatus]